MSILDHDINQFDHDLNRIKFSLGNKTVNPRETTPIVEHSAYAVHMIDKIQAKLGFVKLSHGENKELLDDILTDISDNTDLSFGTNKRNVMESLIDLTSPLTGIASRKSVRKLRNNLSELRSDQIRTRHLVEDMSTIINATNFELLNTKIKVNEITDAVTDLDRNLKKVYELGIVLSEGQNDMKILLELESRLSRIQFLSEYLSRKVNKLVRVLADLSSGKMTIDLLKPKDLKSILNYIADNIPSNLDVAGQGQKGRLLDLYKSLHTESFVHDGKIVTIFTVPLTSTRQKFFLLEAINPYIPDIESGVSVRYVLEGKYLAISSDLFLYSIPSNSEVSVCKSSGRGLSSYCRLQRPTFLTKGHGSCLMSLYLRQESAIKSNCKIEVKDTRDLGFHYISDGSWLITTRREIIIKKSCNDSRHITDIRINPPVTMITLQHGCNAFTGSVLLPSHFSAGSHYNLRLIDDLTTVLTDIQHKEFQILQLLTSPSQRPIFKEWISTEIAKLPIGSSIVLDFKKADLDMSNYSKNKSLKKIGIIVASCLGVLLIIGIVLAYLKFKIARTMIRKSGGKTKTSCMYVLRFIRNFCCGRKNNMASQKKAITDILTKIEKNMTNSNSNITELFQNSQVENKIVPEKCVPLGNDNA